MSNNYIGDIAEDADVYFVFDTASASGASITATVVVADIEVYRQIAAPINLIQRSSTSGFTLAVNHDGATGTHMVCIDTSDNTDAGFFTTGYDYFVKLNTVTVDGVSISKWIGHFSVENRYTGADVVAISGDTAAADNLESMLDGTGGVTLSLGQLAIVASSNDDAIIATGAGTGAGIVTTGGSTGIGFEVVGGGTSGDAIKASATDGHGMYLAGDENNEGFEAVGEGTAAGMTARGGSDGDGLYAASGYNGGEGIYAYGQAVASNGLKAESGGAGKDINADEIDSIISKVDVVDGIVDDILLDTAEIGTAGYGLTEAGGTGDHLSDLGGMSDGMKVEVNTEVNAGIVTYGLDHLVNASVAAADVAEDSIIAQLVSSDPAAGWGGYNNITDSLQANRDLIGTAGAGLTAVSNQVWSASVHPGSTGTGLKLYDISVDTAEIGVNGAGLTDLGGMSAGMKLEIAGECWNADASSHVSAGTTGKILNDLEAEHTDDTILVQTTIATSPGNNTTFTLTDGSIVDDTYLGCTVIIRDGSDSNSKAVGVISDYTGSTKTVTLAYNPGLFTYFPADTVTIIAAPNKVSDDTRDQLADAVWDEDLDPAHVTAGTAGKAVLDIDDALPLIPTSNTALTKFPFFMVSSADHITPKTLLSVTATRSIDGGAFASCANAVVEVDYGIYVIDLAASDTNGTNIALRFTASGADDRVIVFISQPE